MVDPIRPVPRKPYCPPGTILVQPRVLPGKILTHPPSICVRPGFVTPFGGPASGISTAGGIEGAAASAAPGVIVTPPTPVPTCVTPSIFGDCFGLCTGVINAGAPGPVCGWTYIEPFGPLGGEFNFTPGVMSMDTFDADDFPIATKALGAPLASIFGVSGQFEFTEYLTPPNAMTTYQLLVNNFDLSESLFVSFFGDGSASVQAGDPALIPTYINLAAWTPTPGATHVVHFSIDGAGIPTVYLDGVLIPMPFVVAVPSFSTLYPVNSMNYGGGGADVTPGSSALSNLFLTAGSTPPETEFCCT